MFCEYKEISFVFALNIHVLLLREEKIPYKNSSQYICHFGH